MENLSREQCNQIRQFCLRMPSIKPGDSDYNERQIPQSERNHSRPQFASFRYWDKLTQDAYIERAYLNIRDEGSKRLPTSIGYVDLNSGEIVLDTTETFWNKVFGLFNL